MIPTNRPVSRAFVSFVSLISSYFSNNYTKESTSYFPNDYIKLNDLFEIQPKLLTVGITANWGEIDSKFTHPHILTPIDSSRLLSPHTTVIRGI